MRPLPPTLRENRRYILVKIAGEFTAPLTQKEIYFTISEAVTSLFGDVGSAAVHVAVVWSEDEHAIVRCSRGSEQKVIASLGVITKILGAPAVFHSVAVSGTIHGVKKHLHPTTWDDEVIAGYRCSGKKVDSLTGSNTHRYLTRDDIIKE
ncbi:Rpp14/Pop5 family protein [Methanorbis furvi]|uniref:Ribonuclease P protein component 2 n=1 Tax=Methanorbis furvi TaxID=3028299 RepID=A0AAE4S960_9EURY|nr:hypothetical protein [Methanocorpusculaceae archaeon Ag1]